MTETTRGDTSGNYRAVGIALFLCLFAGQAALIAMSPVLADAAGDLHVSTAVAGQLRTITGLAAGITALTLAAVAGRVGLGRQLLAATAVLAIASIASAAAPSFPLLALAQVPVGVAVAVLTTAGTLAAADWVAPELRTRTLSWALVGQPAAWIVGMPLAGVLGEHSWRYGWWSCRSPPRWRQRRPSPRGRGSRPSNRDPRPRAPCSPTARSRAGWHPSCSRTPPGRERSSTRGALCRFVRIPTLTGCLLAVAAVAYVAGNIVSRRLVPEEPRRALVVLARPFAVTDGLFGAAHTGSRCATCSPRGAAAAVAGGRTLVASAFGLATAPEIRPAVMGLRAATMQFGYFVGSIAGGTALAVGGYGALGITMGAFLLGAAALLGRNPASHGATAAHEFTRARRRWLRPALYRARG